MGKETAIATHGLTKQFDRRIAVNAIDLQITEGEVYGLIGANGAGKTTLIRMLAAIEEPTIGEIFIHGDRLLRNDTNARLKKNLGYLPDNYPVYEDLTILDYLDYFARLYGLTQPYRQRRINEVLELVQLVDRRNSAIATLSRGMKQRLSLARTIVHEPIVLLLDEPVSGLDPLSRMQFRETIKTLQEAGMTILISSHILSDLAELCTSIGMMEYGFLVESAPLKEIYSRFSRPQLLITALDNLEALEAELKNCPWVENWQMLKETGSVKVEFSGTREEGAEFLKTLIAAEIAIAQFSYTQENLEALFHSLTVAD
ncbi:MULTISPECIES: ABC transporter ATP-binding protein [Spirulina sp. CCY15215]|uniref:ABC transporter ATP-binding protein n=1 Tax=Spirulina sp. CCY15215 TaxID=2767591 RepID=UPI001951EF7A|nr:ABC transporter ATP-binding protein [Spirulina major]